MNPNVALKADHPPSGFWGLILGLWRRVSPLGQNSCRFDRIPNQGAIVEERSGEIWTSIQRQSGGEVVAIGERTDLDAAHAWGHDFVRGYNGEHRHSGIRYVTPAQRHAGEDVAILAARHQI